ncbi:MAG: hypothetical protein ACR2NZ_02600 [Rubripirellula sp.]
MTNHRNGTLYRCVVAWLLLGNPVFAQSVSPEQAIPNASQDLNDIVEEQLALRRELQDLEHEAQLVKQRLKNLARLAEEQREVDRLVRQLIQAESLDDEVRAARLESKIEPLQRRLSRLREAMDVEEEFDARIGELRALVHRFDRLEGIEEIRWSGKHLATTIDRLSQVREIHAKLNSADAGLAEPLQDELGRQADELGEQIDADEELVELVSRLVVAIEGNQQEAAEEHRLEIGELRIELDREHEAAPRGSITEPHAAVDGKRELASGEYFVTQSWSQERKFRRPYYVSVPKPNHLDGSDPQEFPVFIFLHGNGGNAKRAMKGFMRRRREMASRYVMVFAQGYQESWNIVSERSKADDRGFIEAIVLNLATFDNVDANNFSIMGASNGAALVNQMAIESKLPNVRNYVTGVSPLNVWQYDGKHFKAKGDDNNYGDVANPMKGKRLLNISGTDDELVPYLGGTSKSIPAKDGKLAFVDAEKSTYLWAKQMGFEGEQLTRPTKKDGNLEMFSYLDGDIIHLKVANEGHGATHGIREQVLMEFLEGGDPAQQE